MSRPNKQTGPKSPQERKHGGQWAVKTWGREGIHINDCTDTLFFLFLFFQGWENDFVSCIVPDVQSTI